MNVADADNPVFHAIGSAVCETDGFVFGALMTYTPGTDSLCVIDDDQAFDVQIEKLAVPSTEDGKRREFLESMMYFGIVDNHMVLMQSQALKSPQLESYLRWLLHGAEVLAGTNTFQLIDTPSTTVRQRMEAGKGVRAIKLDGEVLPPSAVARAAPGDQPPVGPAVAVAPTQRVDQISLVTSTVDDDDFGVLAALKKLFSPSQAARIDFAKLAGSNIQMSVTLRYKRNTTEDGQALMDTLGVALRNTDDLDTRIHLKDGGTIRGGDLKLDGKISLTAYDGQFSPSEVYEGMRQWLLSKVTTDELPAG
ncbi:hypothetical protein SAMN04489708_117109 [Paracidovorax cattleyae]|uniref:Uncharacterized protein n=2 Tax=Paracidovorax cattleyae TaxID=80868 RepID=A0A1H0U3L0_9BURK|nr:hypothetical protein SAMN04489708_117109 [Paracidovorax cattleyae]